MTRRFAMLYGGRAADECAAVAPWLADRARGGLPSGEPARVEAHLAACSGCRDTVAALERIWRTQAGPRPDLWERVAARLPTSGATLSFPTDRWRSALVAAILITASWLVPGARSVTTLLLFGAG